MTQLGAVAVLFTGAVLFAAPVSAQNSPDSPPEPIRVVTTPGVDAGGANASGFFGLFALAAVVSIGIAIWKFAALRDMGIRRGMSHQDATTAALFSEDRVTSAMVLKPEVDSRRRRRPLRRGAARRKPEATIESRLAKVDSLHERGLISQAEAASRRDEILDEI